MTKLLFSGVLFFLFFASLAFADCSVSSLTTSASSAAQVGDSVVVTVSYSSSGCSGQQLYLDTSSGLTTDPTSKTLGDDSGSTTFSLSATTEGTYTYNARLSSSQSTSASISYVSPDVLTISGSSSPSSVTGQAKNSAFTLSIVISNPSAASITTTYSFTYDSNKISISGATSGSVTVSAGDTTTLTRSVTPTTYFTGAEVIFNLGSNTGAFTTTVSTVAAPSETASNSADATSSSSTTTTTATNASTGTSSSNQSAQQSSAQSGTQKPSTQTPSPSQTPSQQSQQPEVSEAELLKQEVYTLISNLKAKLSVMKTEGYDTSSVQAKIKEATEAYESGDYAKAKSLILEAGSASKALQKQSEVKTEELQKPAAETKTTPQTSSILPMLGILAVLVVVVLVGAYLLFFNKKKRY